MQKTYSNVCIRCGKERIVGKTWKEKVGNSVIYNRDMVCPDPDCQKKVDADNKRINDKHVAMRMRSEERAHNRHKDKN